MLYRLHITYEILFPTFDPVSSAEYTETVSIDFSTIRTVCKLYTIHSCLGMFVCGFRLHKIYTNEFVFYVSYIYLSFNLPCDSHRPGKLSYPSHFYFQHKSSYTVRVLGGFVTFCENRDLRAHTQFHENRFQTGLFQQTAILYCKII